MEDPDPLIFTTIAVMEAKLSPQDRGLKFFGLDPTYPGGKSR